MSDFEIEEERTCELCGDPVEPEWTGFRHDHYASWRGPLVNEFIEARDFQGVAMHVRHHSVELEEIIGVMVGDNREHRIAVSDLIVIPREAFCGQCGATGCTHDGLVRS